MSGRKSVPALFFFLGIGCLLLATPILPAPPVPADGVEPVLVKNCLICHGEDSPAESLNLKADSLLESVTNVPSRQKPGYKLLDIRRPGRSYLLMKIQGNPEIKGKPMPLKAPPLADDKIKIVREWILSVASALTGAGPDEAEPEVDSVLKTPVSAFPASRLINLETTGMLQSGEFQFLVSHRFQPSVKTGYDTFYGIDGPASVYLQLGYGITRRLNVFVGRTSSFQALNGTLKWLAFNNSASRKHPLEIALALGTTVITREADSETSQSGRVKFHLSLGMSYQFAERVVLLVTPMAASNVNHWEEDSSHTLALGLGLRFQLLGRLSVSAEIIPVLSGYRDRYTGWALGMEYPIGGHVFQVFILNSLGLLTDQFIPGGDLNLSEGDLRFGFSVFRTF